MQGGSGALACRLAREGSLEDRADFERAVVELTDIRWKIERVDEEELERLAHVPASIGADVPVRVTVSWMSTPPRTGGPTLRPPSLTVNGETRSLGWLDVSGTDLPDAFLALFPPPEIPDAVELPPVYERQPYRPTRRPRVRVADRRSARHLEAAVTGFLSALTLGHVRQTGQGSVRLTPESERALTHWYARNSEARQAHEAEEQARADARIEERRQAAQFNSHREDAHRQWRRDFERYQVSRALRSSCYASAPDTLSLHGSPPRSCHWMVLVPRDASGEVELRFEAELPLSRGSEGSCAYAPTHRVSGQGVVLDVIEAELGESRPLHTMNRILPSFRYESERATGETSR